MRTIKLVWWHKESKNININYHSLTIYMGLMSSFSGNLPAFYSYVAIFVVLLMALLYSFKELVWHVILTLAFFIIIIIIIINLTFAFPLSRSSIHLARHYSMFFTFLCEGRGSWTINTAWKASKYAVFSGPYFLVIGLNTEIYAINLRIKAKYTKIRTRKNSVFGHFTQCKITKCSFYLK